MTSQPNHLPRNAVWPAVASQKALFFLLAAVLWCGAGTAFGQEEQRKVSVVAFEPGVGVTGDEVAELVARFEASLIGAGGFDVIARAERSVLLEEQEFSLGAAADESGAVQIGKLGSAEAVFVIRLSQLETQYLVDVRLVDVATGRYLHAETARAESASRLPSDFGRMISAFSRRASYGGSSSVVEEQQTEASEEQLQVQAIVVFESDPPGVDIAVFAGEVMVDENRVGQARTPISFTLAGGSYTVLASDPGSLYRPFRGQLLVDSSLKRRYVIKLEPDFGTLSIRSDPHETEVRLGGIPIGKTPLMDMRLKAGRYTFLLQKDGYDSQVAEVDIAVGVHLDRMVSLVPAFVTLTVEGESPGEVYVDEKSLGDMPVTEHRLPYRDIQLKVLPNDQRYMPYEERIVPSRRGEELRRRIEFQARRARIEVQTEPFLEADILIDGQNTGRQAPDIVDVIIGAHQVAVRGLTSQGQLLSGTVAVELRESEIRRVVVHLFPDQFAGSLQSWLARRDQLLGRLSDGLWVTMADVEEAEALRRDIASLQDPFFAELEKGAETLVTEMSAAAAVWTTKEQELNRRWDALLQAKGLRRTRNLRGLATGLGSLAALGGSLIANGFANSSFLQYQDAAYSIDAINLRRTTVSLDVLKVLLASVSGGAALTSVVLIAGGTTAAQVASEEAAIEQARRELEASRRAR